MQNNQGQCIDLRKNVTSKEFMTLVQNRSVYRRDNIINQLTNQFKQQAQQNDKNLEISKFTNDFMNIRKQNEKSSSNQKYKLCSDNKFVLLQTLQTPLIDRPKSQALGIRKQLLKERQQINETDQSNQQPFIEIKKHLKVALTAGSPKQFSDFQSNDKIKNKQQQFYLPIGQQTKGVPTEISPVLRTQADTNDYLQIAGNRHYLTNLVSDVIDKQKQHNVQYTAPPQQIMNTDKIRDSLVQIVQTNFERPEFEVMNKNDYQNYLANSRFKASDVKKDTINIHLNIESQQFQENLCRKFIFHNKEHQIKKEEFTDEYLAKIADRDSNQFLAENNINPLYYISEQKKVKNKGSVNKFEFFLVKGNQYLHRNDFQKAKRFFQEGLKIFKDSPGFLLNLGLVYLGLKQYLKALKIYSDLFIRYPNSASIFLNLLQTHLFLDQYFNIIQYKDTNPLTRPRALMSIEQQNINKIIIYASKVLEKSDGDEKNRFIQQQKERYQVMSEALSGNIRSNESLKKVIQDQNIEALESQGLSSAEKVPKFDQKYFKKTHLTNYKKRAQFSATKQRNGNSISQTKSQIEKPKISMIQKYQTEYKLKREKFNKILESRCNAIKDQYTLYGQIQTKILKTSHLNTPKNISRQSNLFFTVKPQKKRASSLDLAYKELQEVTHAFTAGTQDPVEEKYKELVEDLRAFRKRQDIADFVKNEVLVQDKEEAERNRPWSVHKTNRHGDATMENQQMQRAKSFIRSMTANKTKKESTKIVQNIEAIIDTHIKDIWEDIKGIKQRQHEKEIYSIIKGMTIKNKDMENIGAIINEDLENIDKSFIQRLVKMRTVNDLTDDEKLIQILGITKDDIRKRKDLQEDKLLNVLCPDGITMEDRDNFDRDTDEFLSYLYNNYLIKSAVIPGTEIPDLFRESIHYDQIKKYIDRLSLTISAKLGVFADDEEENQNQELVWESPIKNRHIKKPSLYSQLVQKTKTLDGENTAKSTLAFYFFQKINTMGFLNKLVKDNMSRIKSTQANSLQVGSLSEQQLGYIEKQLSRKKMLRMLDYQMLDNILTDLKFFSIFEKDIRTKIYKIGSYLKFYQQGTEIDPSLEKTKYMYVVLKGQVTIIKRDFDIGIDLPMISYKAGECFGDLSIQSHTVSPFDLLSKNIFLAQADINKDSCHVFRFERELFIEAVFKEMKDQLYQKIMMLKNAEFFEDLSPYALMILASSVQIKEFKLGDVIIKQGQVPDMCYIILEGDCRAVFEKEVTKSTKVSQFAKKCLQTDNPKPLHFNGLDYYKLAHSSAPENHHKMMQHQNTNEKKKETVKQQNLQKYSFQNEVLNQDTGANTIEYRHHVVFDKLKPGNCFGYRALLDKQLIRRHVIDESENYSQQLNISIDKVQQEYLQLREQSQQEHQTLQSNKTLNMQSTVSINIGNFQDGDKSEVKINIIGSSKKPKARQQSQQNLTYKDQFKNEWESQQQFDEYLPTNSQEDEVATKRQMLLKSKLYDVLMQTLLTSQLSIIADSSSVKTLCIRKEDKQFLNETLKQLLDRKLIEKRFIDKDRPMMNSSEVIKRVEADKEWQEYKERLESQMLREVAMNKKINKLLD